MAAPVTIPILQNQPTSLLRTLGALWQAHGRQVVGVGWIATVLSTLALVAIADPVRHAYLLQAGQNLTPAQSLILSDALAVFGQDFETHVRIVVAIEVLVVLAFTATAALIVHRRRDGVGLLVSAAMV